MSFEVLDEANALWDELVERAAGSDGDLAAVRSFAIEPRTEPV
jgi:hypothetical protein